MGQGEHQHSLENSIVVKAFFSHVYDRNSPAVPVPSHIANPLELPQGTTDKIEFSKCVPL